MRPRPAESLHSRVQAIAPALFSMRTAAQTIKAWAIDVIAKAKAIATYRERRFEFSFSSGIEQTWLLVVRKRISTWFRVSFIDGGGRPVEYENNVFAKFDEAVNDVNQNDNDPTMLFIATDGRRVYKAFTGPESAVGQEAPVFSKGFDDDVFIGIWSHQWLKNIVEDLERKADPNDGWSELMEQMVLAIAEYADQESPPAARSC